MENPSLASSRTIPRPIPRPPPVTTATRSGTAAEWAGMSELFDMSPPVQTGREAAEP